MNLPKISVVTPSFRSAEFLEETILSALHQRYPNFEHIICDGGSEDGTLDVLRKYDGVLAHWVSEQDRGQPHATNKAIERATGEYVVVLNSDDVLLPGAFQYVAWQIERLGRPEWISGQALYFGQNDIGNVMQARPAKHRSEWLFRAGIPHMSTYLRRDVYTRHGMYDESMTYCLDYEYWVRLAFAGLECVAVPRPLAAFRLHENCKSVAFKAKFEAERQRVRDLYSPQMTDSERRGIRERMAQQHVSNALYESMHYLGRGERAEAWRIWREAANLPGAKRTKAFYTSWMRIVLNKPPAGALMDA